MKQATIELLCPACQASWPAEVREVPDPEEPFDCTECGERRVTSAFTRTSRDLEVLREFGAERE